MNIIILIFKFYSGVNSEQRSAASEQIKNGLLQHKLAYASYLSFV
jgi:hypothetical protein